VQTLYAQFNVNYSEYIISIATQTKKARPHPGLCPPLPDKGEEKGGGAPLLVYLPFRL